MSDPAAKAEGLRDAAAKGSLAVLEESIKTNIGDIMSWINDANRRGNTALQLAAMWGHIDCCQALLAAGADKDKASNVRAPPHPPPPADLRGRSSPWAAAQAGHTPLMCAAIKGGRAEVIRELIKLGADVNLRDNVRPRSSLRRLVSLRRIVD